MEERRVSDSSKNSSKEASGIKIGDCFNLFQEPEILAEDNAWYCPKCKEFVLAKKQMQIYKAPKILIVALKRFKRKEYFS
jgi:ubiquitin C-terminal hydrolase